MKAQLTTEKLVKVLGNLPLTQVDEVTKQIARKTKQKRLTSGTMFYSQYLQRIAEVLMSRKSTQSIAQNLLA